MKKFILFLILFGCCFFGSKAFAWEYWIDYRGGWATPVYHTYDGYYYTNYYSPCYRTYYYGPRYYYRPQFYYPNTIRYYTPCYTYWGW